jgi:hypothetical protein
MMNEGKSGAGGVSCVLVTGVAGAPEGDESPQIGNLELATNC